MIQEICSWVEQYNLKTQGSIANWWSNVSPQTINRANCFYWMFVDKVCLHNYMCEPSKNGQNSKTKLLLVNFRCKPFKNLQKLFWTNPSPVANATARWWTLGFQPRAAKGHLSSETQGAFVWTYPWTTGPLEQGAMGTGNLEVGSGGNLWGWKWMENDGNRRVFFGDMLQLEGCKVWRVMSANIVSIKSGSGQWYDDNYNLICLVLLKHKNLSNEEVLLAKVPTCSNHLYTTNTHFSWQIDANRYK